MFGQTLTSLSDQLSRDERQPNQAVVTLFICDLLFIVLLCLAFVVWVLYICLGFVFFTTTTRPFKVAHNESM